MKATQALPAEQQIEAVSKKLMELNPGFDGKITGLDGKGIPKIEKGVVTGMELLTDNVTDISPVRALAGVTYLNCSGNSLKSRSKLSDLSPLQGMKLTSLSCYFTQVSDLSPLREMPLGNLYCRNTQVSDLSPLERMPLKNLSCSGTKIATLSPLQGMKLASLYCSGTPVSDLSPLEGCTSLTSLSVIATKVTPAGVAALQKALPNCKIEWDDPAKPKTPEPAASGTK